MKTVLECLIDVPFDIRRSDLCLSDGVGNPHRRAVWQESQATHRGITPDGCRGTVRKAE